MKEEAGIPRSSGSRIDISRSLAIGRTQRSAPPTDQTQTSPAAPTNLQAGTSSTPPVSDAAKVSISAALATIAAQSSESPTESPPQTVIPSSREAAKASYLRQSQAPPVPPPGNFAASSGPSQKVPDALQGSSEEDIDLLLAQLRRSFNEEDVPEVESAPSGDSPDELLPLAQKYVAFLEPPDAPYTEAVRSEKVSEVVKFYSAPSRQGRLKSLVSDI